MARRFSISVLSVPRVSVLLSLNSYLCPVVFLPRLLSFYRARSTQSSAKLKVFAFFFAGGSDPNISSYEFPWLLSQNTLIAPLNKDFTDFAADPIRIDPAGTRTNSEGKTLSVIGHEGATMLKVGSKYVHLGTTWSTDIGRKGSYNLYYCTADKITGPYGPRQFAGRFLGHGTPFQTRDGHWWCTAFFNANIPPLPANHIQTRDLSKDAQTINPRGTTIVPLDIKALSNGSISIRALDPAYATPGPDEAQKF